MLDRVRWWANKKPSGKTITYLGIVLPWSFVGILSFLGIIILLIGVTDKIPKPIIVGSGTLLSAVVYSIFLYLSDRGRNYIDSIHKTYLDWREELKGKLGK